MYQNIANQNPLLMQFNGYRSQNINHTPFQSNQLINNNIHVMNHLSDNIQHHKNLQQNIHLYQQQLNPMNQSNQMSQLNQRNQLNQMGQMSQLNQMGQMNQLNQMGQMNQLNQMGQMSQLNQMNPLNQLNQSGTSKNQSTRQTISEKKRAQKNSGSKNMNIIEEMLKPQKIMKDNKDVETNFEKRNTIQSDAKKGKINIKITNTPYKNIIKDKIITKDVDKVELSDLLVHKSKKEIDADINKFNEDLHKKEDEKEKINDELQIEFNIDNYDKHKKKFEYNETFIRNLYFEENTFDESKQDYIDFYKKKQKEAEEGQKLCDHILRNIVDEGIVSKDELPTQEEST